MAVNFGGRKLELAISTFRSVLFDFIQQFLWFIHVRKCVSAKWTLFLSTFLRPLFDAVSPEHMSCSWTLTIRNSWFHHEPQTNAAKQVLMTLLCDYQWLIHTISHVLFHVPLNIILSFTYKEYQVIFLLISIGVSRLVGCYLRKCYCSHIIYFEMNFQEGRTTANSNTFQPQSQYRPIPPSF